MSDRVWCGGTELQSREEPTHVNDQGLFHQALLGPPGGGKRRAASSRVQLERPQGARWQQRVDKGAQSPSRGRGGGSSWWGRGLKQVGARGASELRLRPQFLEPRYRLGQAALGSGTTDNRGPPASSMENKRTRMFTSHIHNGPSQKPSQQHGECVNCGACPRQMLGSWDEESAPGMQQGPRPLTGAEGHPRVHCGIQCMQVEPSQNAPPLRSVGTASLRRSARRAC